MARKSKPATTTEPDEPSTGRGRKPSRHKAEKPASKKPPKKKAKEPGVKITGQGEVDKENSNLTTHTPSDPIASTEIEPKTPAGAPVVLNTCDETLRKDAGPEHVNLNWTEIERRDMADAFTTVERRRAIMEQTAEAARIAKKAYDTAVDIWFEKSKSVMHGQPEIDPKSGQRNMFPAVPSTPSENAAANNGVLARIGKAPATDDEIRHVISNICEATVWQNDLSRVGLSAPAAVVLDKAGIRRPGDLLLLAAKRGVRWWHDIGLAESEARAVMHKALGCLLTMNDDILSAFRQIIGEHLAGQVDALDDDNAWPNLMALGLDDKSLVQRVPTQSRERFERAAGHLALAGIFDAGTAVMLLMNEPQWWWTRFPGIENEALDIEVFASAMGLALQDHCRAVTLAQGEPAAADETEPEAEDESDND